jgi:hypothetical protein
MAQEKERGKIQLILHKDNIEILEKHYSRFLDEEVAMTAHRSYGELPREFALSAIRKTDDGLIICDVATGAPIEREPIEEEPKPQEIAKRSIHKRKRERKKKVQDVKKHYDPLAHGGKVLGEVRSPRFNKPYTVVETETGIYLTRGEGKRPYGINKDDYDFHRTTILNVLKANGGDCMMGILNAGGYRWTALMIMAYMGDILFDEVKNLETGHMRVVVRLP